MNSLFDTFQGKYSNYAATTLHKQVTNHVSSLAQRNMYGILQFQLNSALANWLMARLYDDYEDNS
jgi:hypothetical protein